MAVASAIYIPSEDDFTEPGAAFLKEPSLDRLADNVLLRHFPEFVARGILFRWKKIGGTTHGKPRFAMTTKPSGWLAHLTDAPFLIWLAADHIRGSKWRLAEIEAAIYHELCHCGLDEDGKPMLLPHDFEGFGAELREYGAWRSDLSQLVSLVQGELFRNEA